MKLYHCSALKTDVFVVCRNKLLSADQVMLEVLLFDSEGVLLFPITIPFCTHRENCSYVTDEKSWLPKFLVDNKIANPTYRRLHKGGHVYSEYKFERKK